MSLRVWLPLNGDLHNQGISDLEFSNENTTTITINNNGKIGKCYTRSTIKTAGRIVSNKTILLNGDLSICCWAKVTATVGDTANGLVTNHSHADNTGFGLTIKQASGEDYRISCNTGNGSGRTYCTYYGSTNIKNNWHHLALTYNNTLHQFQLWVDGHVEVTQSYTNQARADKIYIFDWSTTYNDASYRPACSLNDVRIYDHCLSAAEVKEIAQGLVLHYKLDDAVGFTDLIARNTNVTAYNNHGNTNNPTTITYLNQQYNGDRIIQYSATPNSSVISSIQTSLHSHGIYNWNKTFKANTKYVFWIYYKPITHLDTIAGGTASNIGGWTEIPPVAVGGGWYRVGQYRNGTVTTDKTDNIFVSYKTPSAIAGDNIIIYFASPHLLEGTTEIPPYDYPATIIQDSSGYNHNGIITGDLTFTSESQRYSIATKWNCSDPTTNNNTGLCYIQTPLTLTTPLQISITWWAKPESGYGGSTNHAAFCTSNNTSAPTDYNTTAFHHRDSGFDIYPSDGSGVKRLSFSYTKNEWHHYAVTYDGTTARTYQDGVLKTSIEVGANKTLASFSQLYIGFSKAGGVWRKTLGSYSDFRVYVTQLLDTDIKQLYNVGMKIDNLGSTHTFEFIEQQSNIIFPIELSRSNLEFTNGLSRYTQPNCQVTLTDQGYHIYRPPNLTTANNGNTMWGGLKLVNQKTDTIAAYDSNRDNSWGLQKGHTYFAAFHAKGKSSNSTSWSWSNNMGWGGGGVDASPTIIANIGIPFDFQGEKDCIFIFTINDDIAKNCTSAYSSYAANTTYLSYRHLTFGWGYSSTGALGTDLYLTDLRLYDITNYMAKITKQGQAKFYDFVEQLDKAQIRRNSEFLSTNFIER